MFESSYSSFHERNKGVLRASKHQVSVTRDSKECKGMRITKQTETFGGNARMDDDKENNEQKIKNEIIKHQQYPGS